MWHCVVRRRRFNAALNTPGSETSLTNKSHQRMRRPRHRTRSSICSVRARGNDPVSVVARWKTAAIPGTRSGGQLADKRLVRIDKTGMRMRLDFRRATFRQVLLTGAKALTAVPVRCLRMQPLGGQRRWQVGVTCSMTGQRQVLGQTSLPPRKLSPTALSNRRHSAGLTRTSAASLKRTFRHLD